MFQHPKFSPDGTRMVVDVRSASDRHIWVYELERGTRTRLTTEGFNLDPLWTPDGERITFRSHRAGSGAGALYWTLADGSGVPELLHAEKISGTPGAWSPGADRLVFTTMPARRQWILDFAGGGALSRLFPTEPGAGFPAFSPDGRFVAYVSNESGRDEIFVRAYPGPAGKWPVSAAGGQEPVWAPHGRELFYRNRDVMMAVAVTTEPTFSSEAPRPLFRGSYDRSDNGHQHFDVSPDGETFAMISSEDMAYTSEIRIVLDWLPELEQLPATQN
jgi:serine/threonine-protein kinase